jgi:hypothetical protein
MNPPDAPTAQEDYFAAHSFTVRDQEKSRDFYVRILGGKLIKPENPSYIKLANTWIILNCGGHLHLSIVRIFRSDKHGTYYKTVTAIVLSLLIGPIFLQAQSPSFSIIIANNNTETKVHDPIILTVRLTNRSSNDLEFFHNGRSNGESIFDIEIRDSKGNLVPMKNYYKAVKGINQGPGPETVVVTTPVVAHVKPTMSFESTIDLAKCSDLHPGTYSVRVSRMDDATKRIITSNSISLTLT